MKTRYGLEEGETAVQVRSVAPRSPLHSKVLRGDLLTAIDGNQINGDGMIVYHIGGQDVSMPFSTMVTSKAPDEATTLTLVRVNRGAKTVFNVTQVLGPLPPLTPRFYDAPLASAGRAHFAASPSYFIVGGLVWGIASMPVFSQAESSGYVVPWSLKKNALQRWLPSSESNSTGTPDVAEFEEVVVLLHTLAHACTAHYDLGGTMRGLDYFNGERVKSLAHLVQLVGSAEAAGEELLRFTFTPLADRAFAGDATDPDVVLVTSQCSGADSDLLQRLYIPSRCSADMKSACVSSIPSMSASSTSGSRSSFLEQHAQIDEDALIAQPRAASRQLASRKLVRLLDSGLPDPELPLNALPQRGDSAGGVAEYGGLKQLSAFRTL